MIHCFVSPIHATAGFDCSIVYAHNDRNDREALWNDFYNWSQKMALGLSSKIWTGKASKTFKSKKDEQARLHLMNCQEKLHANPSNESYASEQVEARMASISVHKAYQSFLQQKAKRVRDWDKNTTLFHASIKQRRLQNKVFSIKKENGAWVHDPDKVPEAFLEYYQHLLGEVTERTKVNKRILQEGLVLTLSWNRYCSSLLLPQKWK